MDEIRKIWVRVCALDDVPADKTLGLIVNGQRLILARCDNEAHVYQGFCPHMLFPLAGSRVDECILTCGLHHSRFDVRSGAVIDWSTYPPLVGPMLAELRTRKALRRYETRVVDGDVYLSWAADKPENVRVRVNQR